jgi:DNA-binding beta-propeller fold protein YncE
MKHMRLGKSVVWGLLAVTLASRAAFAQETVYLLQSNPPTVHGFTFDGSSLERLDIDPEAGSEVLRSSITSNGFQVTDHWFVLGGVQNANSVSIVDASGIELPAVASSSSSGAGLVLSADRRFAFTVVGAPVPARMAVVDIDPASAGFLTELSVLDLTVGGAGLTRGAALSVDGSTLYVAVTGFGNAGDGCSTPPFCVTRIQAVDVTDPETLGPGDVTTVDVPAFTTWDPAGQGIRILEVGGTEFLFLLRHDLQVFTIDGPGVLTPYMTQSSNSPTTFSGRRVQDVWAFDDGGTPRAIAAVDSCDWDGSNCLPTGEQELLAIDLTAPADFNPVDQSTAAHRVPAAGGGVKVAHGWNARLAASVDGSSLFLVSNNPDPGAGNARGRLLAYDVADLLDGGGEAAPLSTFFFDSSAASADGADLLVTQELMPSVSRPQITSAAVDGASTLQNDQPRTLEVSGSNLIDARHAYLGVATAAIDLGSLTNDYAEVTVQPLVPSGNPSLVLVDGSGGVGGFDGLTVVNPASFLPAAVAYVTNGTGGSISELNAATETEVAGEFSTVQGPVDARVTADGRFLVVGGWDSTSVGVHCLVVDPVTQAAGCTAWNELLTVTPLPSVGGEMAVHPDGSRLYVNTVWPTVEIFDFAAQPPTHVASMEISEPDPPFDPEYITRGIEASPDYLYLGNNFDPHVLAVDIGDDTFVREDDLYGITIPAIAHLGGRSDGLALHPDGTRLYFAASFDARLWILDVGTDPLAPPVTEGPALPNFTVGEVWHISIKPDGSEMYVGGRSSGRTHIYDLSDKDAPAHVISVFTGQQSNLLVVDDAGEFVYVPSGGDSAVSIIDVRAGSSTRHQVLTRSGVGPGANGVAITPGLLTEPGQPQIEPTQGVTLTFDDLTGSGSTTVTSANVSEIPLPTDFQIAGIGVYYDISTTAQFASVEVCIDYDEGLIPMGLAEEDLRLLHGEELDGAQCDPPGTAPCWDDVTSPGSPDVGANTICGEVTHFSQFVAAAQAIVRPEMDILPRQINLRSNAVVPVVVFGAESFDVATIEIDTLELAGAPPRQGGPGVRVQDHDGDGYPDLVAQFRARDLDLETGDVVAELTAELSSGQTMIASDQVRVR